MIGVGSEPRRCALGFPQELLSGRSVLRTGRRHGPGQEQRPVHGQVRRRRLAQSWFKESGRVPHKAAQEGDEASLGVRLLTDLRDKVFCGADRMPTAAILEVLLGLDDAPWADLSDDGPSSKPLTARGLSKLLSQYVRPDNTPIRPRGIRVGSGTPKGYYAEDLGDAWTRYWPLPPPPAAHRGLTPTAPAVPPCFRAAAPIRNTKVRNSRNTAGQRG
nr:DUF3631 domain-containing protein [Streptomyces noursei]